MCMCIIYPFIQCLLTCHKGGRRAANEISDSNQVFEAHPESEAGNFSEQLQRLSRLQYI